MTTTSYNLVDEPWIPVTLAADFPGGAARGPAPRVSLREAFAHGDCILDLRCYPHERIALMRLLICIAQRALNGPANEEEWQVCRADFAAKTVAYLEEYRHCFNLFGDGPRFMQSKAAATPTTFSAHKLRFVDESGPTLFNAHVEPGVPLAFSDLAVALVTFQSFAAGGRVEGSTGSLTAGPCREGSALHALILGSSLGESLWNNVLAKEAIGERGRIVFGDASWHSDQTAGRSYLYRLAPVCRRLWLHEDGAFVDGYGGQDLLSFASDGVREFTASIQRIERRADGAVEQLVSATQGRGVAKAAWRELHSVAVVRSADKRGGPPAFEHLRRVDRSDVRLWCGALVGGGQGRASAVGDVIESVFRLPVRFLEDVDAVEADDPMRHPGPNRTYRQGVGLAEQWSGRLRDAVKEYRKRLQDKKAAIQAHAAVRYWTALEQKAEPVLLHAVAVRQEGFDPDNKSWMLESPWGTEVKRAARDAYEFACPHATPRQLRAYAAGLTALFGDDRKRPSHGDEDVNPSREEAS
jgi:CRISPR system Cascade subunit CasA